MDVLLPRSFTVPSLSFLLLRVESASTFPFLSSLSLSLSLSLPPRSLHRPEACAQGAKERAESVAESRLGLRLSYM